MNTYIGGMIMFMALPIIIGCAPSESGTQKTEKQTLSSKKQIILDLAKSGTCMNDAECRYMGLGSKPCGGPWEYFVYSTTVDTTRLHAMVREYRMSEDAYNKKWGVMSDCSIPSPPDSIRCIDGKCAGFYNGIPK